MQFAICLGSYDIACREKWKIKQAIAISYSELAFARTDYRKEVLPSRSITGVPTTDVVCPALRHVGGNVTLFTTMLVASKVSEKQPSRVLRLNCRIWSGITVIIPRKRLRAQLLEVLEQGRFRKHSLTVASATLRMVALLATR